MNARTSEVLQKRDKAQKGTDLHYTARFQEGSGALTWQPPCGISGEAGGQDVGQAAQLDVVLGGKALEALSHIEQVALAVKKQEHRRGRVARVGPQSQDLKTVAGHSQGGRK
jgi:hypothetical protein